MLPPRRKAASEPAQGGAKPGTLPEPKGDDRLPPPGSVLTRKYKGGSVQVKVLAAGCEHAGRIYGSLSAVAKAVTGSHCNGFLPAICKRPDQSAAALVKDLNQRGLLDSTLVHWGGEIGRLPVCEGKLDAEAGRDHNGPGFTCWLADGVKPGTTSGETDEFGHKARRTSSRQ